MKLELKTLTMDEFDALDKQIAAEKARRVTPTYEGWFWAKHNDSWKAFRVKRYGDELRAATANSSFCSFSFWQATDWTPAHPPT